MMHPPPKPRAFTLPELLVAAAVVGVAIALLVLMGGRSRKLGQCGESMANLKQIGALTGSYGADHQDRMWGYTWRQGQIPDDADMDLRATVNNDITAAAAEAVQIMRRRGNDPTMPAVENWFPHINFNHLALVDYAATASPAMWLLSPGDRNRVNWASDIPGYRRGIFGPNQPSRGGSIPTPAEWRWSYSSSYELSYAYYAPDSGDTISQAFTHFTYFAPSNGSVLGPRQLSEVVYPSHKAMMWDSHAWYYGPRVLYSPIIGARFPVLFADGSAAVRTRIASTFPTNVNGGWNPRNPTSPFALTYTYEPGSWEPPTPSGQPSVQVTGFHRWTRRGLGGRDFDANERELP